MLFTLLFAEDNSGERARFVAELKRLAPPAECAGERTTTTAEVGGDLCGDTPANKVGRRIGVCVARDGLRSRQDLFWAGVARGNVLWLCFTAAS